MTAEEIRNLEISVEANSYLQIRILREIGAQLAEQNELMREDKKLRAEFRDEERNERIKRDELLASSAAGIDAFRKSVEAPPQPVPVFRSSPQIVAGADVPQHLGCLVLMPDGSHGIAVEGGIVPLDPEEAKRLLAVLSNPPSEGKPQ